VREHLQDEPGYTSVLKILQILDEKGHVRHESESRAYRYYPTVAPEDAGRTALGRIIDKIFLGSAEMALARLAEEQPVSRTDLGACAVSWTSSNGSPPPKSPRGSHDALRGRF
jgi:predicted transcriptional regulator